MPSPSGSPNLEQLRKQAKDLLRACRAGDPHALARLAAHLPHRAAPRAAPGDGPPPRLADALLVIAREAGFASWPRFKTALVAEPAAALSQEPTRVMRPPTARQAAMHALAEHVVDLARRGETEELAQRFASLPLRDILAVRALVAGSVEYTALVDAFLSGLDHPNARMRYDCVHALDHFADERCVPGLRRLLSDPASRVRRMALHTLSCAACKLAPLPVENDLTSQIIERATADPSINVRRHAALALGACGGDSRGRHASVSHRAGE